MNQLDRLWRSLLQTLRSRLARLRERATRVNTDRLEVTGAMPDMRHIYRAMLGWSARHGYRRGTATTPWEFAAQLPEHLAVHRDSIRLLTEFYVRARYGSTDLSTEDLTLARCTVEQLSRIDARTEQPKTLSQR